MATTEEKTIPREQTRVEEKRDGARPVDVRTERTGDQYSGIAVAHERFGGIDVPASLVGMLTALSTALILAGVLGAAFGVVDYQTGLEGDAEDLALVTIAGGVGVIFVAYVIGGWAAGRIARYDGARNGFAAGVWTLILVGAAGLGAWLGSEYDVYREVNLPQWFSTDEFTISAIAGGIAAIAAMFIGGVIGGLWGGRYHRRADRTIVTTPAGTDVRT
jgi:hypothetical protein